MAVPDSIRYSSPGLKPRPSGATSRVPFRGGRMPPPRRGTPLTKRTPPGTPRSRKCARLTQLSAPWPFECTTACPVPGTILVGRYAGSRYSGAEPSLRPTTTGESGMSRSAYSVWLRAARGTEDQVVRGLPIGSTSRQGLEPSSRSARGCCGARVPPLLLQRQECINYGIIERRASPGADHPHTEQPLQAEDQIEQVKSHGSPPPHGSRRPGNRAKGSGLRRVGARPEARGTRTHDDTYQPAR